MSKTNPEKTISNPAISEDDIVSTDLNRRSFLKGLGVFTGITTLGLTAAACGDDPVTPESDVPDSDDNDSFDVD